MNKINVGLIGFGNVGCGVVKILRERRALLKDKIGLDLCIKRICDKDIISSRQLKLEKSLLTSDPRAILDDPQIDIVVELIGGVSPAKDFISQAIMRGKHVVTANKALLSLKGSEIFALASRHQKSICFESSVAAGIPIIKSLREGLVANKFNSVFGIVNGTSNFILSQMSSLNCEFNAALEEAKKKGFAESNPILDIQGIDSAHKLIILVYLCFGRFVSIKDIFVEGIEDISLSDINYAKELGFQIKLLAIAKKESQELQVRVHPTLIPNTHLLASVNGVFNAIYVSSDLAGNLLFYGPGAGRYSAASGVVSDIVDLAQDIKAGLFRPVMNISTDKSITKLSRMEDVDSRYYVRFMTQDKPGVLAKISTVLAKCDISIASVSQKQRKKSQVVPIVMIIHQAKEKNLRRALDLISRMSMIKSKPVAIRMEDV